jgi:hypothetical protein
MPSSNHNLSAKRYCISEATFNISRASCPPSCARLTNPIVREVVSLIGRKDKSRKDILAMPEGHGEGKG